MGFHRRKRHKLNLRAGKWPCPKCANVFQNAKTLTEHFRELHRLGQFGCSACYFQADNRIVAAEHVKNGHKKHGNQKRGINCKSYYKKSNKTEIKPKPAETGLYSLDVHNLNCFVTNCDQVCSDKEALRKHLLRKHKLQHFICLICLDGSPKSYIHG